MPHLPSSYFKNKLIWRIRSSSWPG
jgi:hypothetical protein